VLLIMGFGMHSAVWAPQVRGLEAQHRVLTFDNRGIRHSQYTRGPWRMRHLADDARRVLDAAEVDRAHVVGVSMGGMVAQHLALNAPDRLRSLTLIVTHAGGPFRWVPTGQGVKWFVRANTSPPQERIQALQHLLYTPSFVAGNTRPELDARMQQVVGKRAHPRTLLSQLAAVLRHDTRRALRRIATPTLVVQAQQDLLVRPGHSDELHRGIPGARLKRIAQGGHAVTFEAADEVNAALLEHFAALDGPALDGPS
jgi:pimeloyl-ACP methyl ester carboxylesterase